MDAFKDSFPGVIDEAIVGGTPTTSTSTPTRANTTSTDNELRKIKSIVAGTGTKSSPSGEEKSDGTPENSDKLDFFGFTIVPSTSNGCSDGRDLNNGSTHVNKENGCDEKQKQGNSDCSSAFVDNKNMSKSFSLFEMHGRTFDQSDRDQEQQDKQEQEDVKKTLAFTIDFDTGRDVNQQRHKSMLERFEQQQRHRRGQSLVKFEEGRASPVTPNKPPLSGKLPRKKSVNAPSDSSISSDHEPESRAVPVRLRDRSAQSLRDSSKRHSWSPRSSLHEQALNQQNIINNNNNNVKKVSGGISTRFTPRSSILSSTLDSSQRTYPSLDSSSNDGKSLNSFPCPEPPLENFKPDDDNVSEAGTYTVEGDNYTEEQKERMNIDKLAGQADTRSITPTFNTTMTRPKRPTGFKEDLTRMERPATAPVPPRRGKNVLEVSCRYETSTAKPKVSYLDKLKTRVKNIGEKTFQKGKSPDKTLPSPDLGCFTSITTGGILSVKPSLEDKVQLPRRNSLSKATVDNSEYVEGVSKVNVADTDKMKLNVMTGETIALGGVSTPNTSTDSPKTSTDDESAQIIDKSTQVLKTASNKKDWIQEWARNAREYSTKAKAGSGGTMARSYEFENSMRSPTRQPAHRSSVEPYQMHRSGYDYDYNDELLCDRNYPYKPFINNAIGDFEYSSDPNLRYKEYQNLRMKQLHYGSDQGMAKRDYVLGLLSPSRAKNAMLYGYDDVEPVSPTHHGRRSPAKPPVSPSKIPSPIHTITRPRSASTSRSNHASNMVSNNLLLFYNRLIAYSPGNLIRVGNRLKEII